MPRKRARDEAELDMSIVKDEQPPGDRGLLWRLRNMWQFASFMQYTYFFGKIVKIDESLDMEEFEEICLSPDRYYKLAEMGLAMLKYVSSHRGLTPEIFDEYTRRQYTAKAPLRNPFGDAEEPNKFADFDIFAKIKVLHQLSIWTLGNAERIRSLMPEKESEHTQWRIEPFGWDSDDRTYYLLDDDRLYRCTEAPLPPTPVKAKPKPKAKPRSKPTRASKRQKLSTSILDSEDEADVDTTEVEEKTEELRKTEGNEEENDYGGMTWECIAVTKEEYDAFLSSIAKSRDPNEKVLHKALLASVMPILEKRAESQRLKLQKRQRELENLQRMATAKRSSRIADKAEKQREAEESAESERKRLAELKMAHKEQQRHLQMEEARQSRMQTREQRLKEREVKRILHEEEIARLEELNARSTGDIDSRHSERNLKNEMERRQKELEELRGEEDKWVFDCSGCGLYGENIDDGTHSVACERCNIWQHSKCNGIKEEDAEREDFHFICADCKRKEEDAKRPKIPPLKLGKIGSSPQTDRAVPSTTSTNGHANGDAVSSVPHDARSPTKHLPAQQPPATPTLHLLNGPTLSPYSEAQPSTISGPNGSSPASQPAGVIHNDQGTAARLPPVPPPEAMQVHQRIHDQAHHQAIQSSGLNQHTAAPSSNGQQPLMTPQVDQPQQMRQPLPQTSYMTSFSARGSPVKVQQTPSPSAPRFVDRSSPFTGAAGANGQASPRYNLSPPPNDAHQQRIAGQSPVKQASPSPAIQRFGTFPLSSPAMPPPPSSFQHAAPTATPAPQVARPPASSPAAAGFLRATPQAASSPIPPVGDGPVIPQKHDPHRGGPAATTPTTTTQVFPPATALSPSRLQDGRGMGVQAGLGGLGTGGIPVKKLPSSPVQDVVASSPLPSREQEEQQQQQQ